MDPHELSKAYDPTDVEPRWYGFWTERDYFRADPSSAKPPYSIVLPPPNVTGSLHLGHALTATLQDILIRWKRMSGHECLWLPGMDHAGIATQMVVERELQKSEGKSRHDLGRTAFLERVWQWKEKYGARIGEQHKVLGASLDWSRERFTMDPGLSPAVREVFVRLYEEGLIYRAQRLINWCPSCRTALSDLEVEHEEQQGSLWHIAYPVKGSDRRLVVATTRPETMLGDTAVAIHPDDPRYAGLAGQTAILPLVEREIPIIADPQLVNMEFGTGVVKVTPAHDFNDYETGLRHRLPMVSIFDEAARTNANAGPFAGLDRLEARRRVLEALAERGLLVKEEPHALSVGTCQRCGTVVEPMLSPQWFVKIEPLAKPAIAAVEEGRTHFVPESWTQVYFHWMRHIHDWCISRQIWWGHQIPAWYCRACSPDLRDLSRVRPIVAREQPARCEECGGGELVQDPDVLDTWFSSALWPFSTLGWPKDTPELRTFYPTSVMETGHDIIFFWVARMMMMGLHFMGEVPFRTVYLHAMVRDEKGEKMSKVKGNVIDPLDVVRGAPAEQLPPAIRNKFPQGMPAFGADALRFTLAALTQQGRDIKLSLDRVAGYKAFVNKLWNAARFALMNLGDFRADDTPIEERPLSLADRWIVSRLDRAIAETQLALDEFRFSDGASVLYQFLWYELCDWYIELSKIALNAGDATARDAARATLVFSLDHVLRLLHPFMPFVTEEIWQKLPMQRDWESIMIAQYPTPDVRLRDEAAERE
ncbi:MAG TPA: valine--tRNA ligase, partial [Myxococcaceae bacterium]|nr:valine--tRNA ligase [Myxococcaceae bacterium]